VKMGSMALESSAASGPAALDPVAGRAADSTVGRGHPRRARRGRGHHDRCLRCYNASIRGMIENLGTPGQQRVVVACYAPLVA
jgi:hypothetical protein